MANPVIHVEVLGKDAASLQSFYRNVTLRRRARGALRQGWPRNILHLR